MDLNADLNGNLCCNFELSLFVCNGARTWAKKLKITKIKLNKIRIILLVITHTIEPANPGP